MEAWSLLLEIVGLLAACAVGGAVLARLKQSPIVGYLLAGMVIGGPGSLGVVRSQSHIEAIAELGVALLLFGLGLEFSVQRMRSLGRSALFGGVLQVGLTLGVTAACVALTGATGAAALTLGAMIALSSTAVVLRSLVARGEVDSPGGRASIAVLLVQDMAVVPLAVLVTALGRGGGAWSVAFEMGKTLGPAIGLVLVLYVTLNHVILPLIRRLGTDRDRELSVLIAAVIGLGATILAHAMGLSPALGAFLAGMFLGSSPLALQFRADVSSLRTLLLTLFFGAVGMLADPLWIAANALQVAGVSAALIAGKALLAWGALRLAGQPRAPSVTAAVSLAQIGEFAFVIGSIARTGGTITEATHSLMVSAAMVSLLATPYLIAVAPRLGLAWVQWRGHPVDVTDHGAAPHPCDILVIGFGVAGRGALAGVDPTAAAVSVVEMRSDTIEAARAAGYHCVLGDATNEEVLDHAGVRTAKLVVITPPSRDICLAVLALARAMVPGATFIARSRYASWVPALQTAGATTVACDEQSVGAVLRAAVTAATVPADAPVPPPQPAVEAGPGRT
jgi:CPA2 family monovalent cation:H+ antiporter-2